MSVLTLSESHTLFGVRCWIYSVDGYRFIVGSTMDAAQEIHFVKFGVYDMYIVKGRNAECMRFTHVNDQTISHFATPNGSCGYSFVWYAAIFLCEYHTDRVCLWRWGAAAVHWFNRLLGRWGQCTAAIIFNALQCILLYPWLDSAHFVLTPLVCIWDTHGIPSYWLKSIAQGQPWNPEHYNRSHRKKFKIARVID